MWPVVCADMRAMLTPPPAVPTTPSVKDRGFFSLGSNALYGKDIISVAQFTKKEVTY